MQQSGRVDSQIGKNLRFESSVNSEGIETLELMRFFTTKFESSVNSEGIETGVDKFTAHKGLRAV